MTRRIPDGTHVPREQFPFIMAGKRYLLARLLVQIIVVAAFAVAVWSGKPIVHPLAPIGAALFLLGLVLRRWSMKVMGERFRGFEVRREDRGLETRGPYSLIRHPGYLGLALMDVGLPLLFGVTWALLLSVILVAQIVQRIRLEEDLLGRAYPEYAGFSATRRRLIPGIW